VGGKLIRKTLKTDVLSVAKLRMDDLAKEERKRVETTIETAKGKVTFKELLEEYQKRRKADPNLKKRTLEHDDQRILALKKSWSGIEQLDARRVTITDLRTWATAFQQQAAPTTFNHTLSVVRHCLNLAIEFGARYDNPAMQVKRAKEKQKRVSLPEPSQFAPFVAALRAGGSRDSRSCADLVEFLAYGGFRKTEAANVKWGDCNFQRGIITVSGDPEEGTKNGEVRDVPMIPEMRKLLTRLKQARPEDDLRAKVMLVHECQKSMDRAAIAVKMKRITHHDLRHLFATRCIESGVDIPTVSRWLGHKDGGALAMKTYGHLRDAHSSKMALMVSFSATSEPATF
jgi:integrase